MAATTSSAPRWFGHVNINVTDLDRTEAFYCGVLGLSPTWRTAPDTPQDGRPFGIDGEVRWVGVLAMGRAGPRGPLLDILQWTLPATGPRVQSPRAVGFGRLRFDVADLAAVTARLSALGAPWQRDPLDASVHAVDPDGIAVVLREHAAGAALTGVYVGCRDLAATVAYYEQVFGLERLPGGGPAPANEVELGFPGDRDTFRIVVSAAEARDGATGGALRPMAAHDCGIYRLAFLSRDLPGRVAGIEARTGQRPPIYTVELGPGLGTVDAIFFGDPDGLVYEYVDSGPSFGREASVAHG